MKADCLPKVVFGDGEYLIVALYNRLGAPIYDGDSADVENWAEALGFGDQMWLSLRGQAACPVETALDAKSLGIICRVPGQLPVLIEGYGAEKWLTCGTKDLLFGGLEVRFKFDGLAYGLAVQLARGYPPAAGFHLRGDSFVETALTKKLNILLQIGRDLDRRITREDIRAWAMRQTPSL
jgi:hypothetical protein